MLMEVLTASFWGAIMCLDRSCLQIMISRPIVVAPIIGFILGNLHAGLITGALLELFWSDRLPIGTYVPPNDSLVSVLIVSSTVLAAREIGHNERELLALSVLLLLPLGRVTRTIDTLIIKANDKLSRAAVAKAEQDGTGYVASRHLIAIVRSLCCNFVVLLISLAISFNVMVWVYPFLPQPVLHALTLIYFILPLLGVAVAMNTIGIEGIIPVFCTICLTVMILLEFIHAF